MSPPSILFQPLSLAVVADTVYRQHLDKVARDVAYEFAPAPSTVLKVLVTAGDRFLAGIWTDCDQAELFSFVDDTEFDLLSLGGGETSPGVSPDRKAGRFEICGNTSPASHATNVIAHGRLRVSTASGIHSERSKPVLLQAGTSVSVGGFTFRIADVGYSDYGADYQAVTFLRTATTSELRTVASVRFEDSTGRQLDAIESYKSAQGIDDEFELIDNYVFSKDQSEVCLVVDLWDGRVESDYEYRLSTGIACLPTRAS